MRITLGTDNPSKDQFFLWIRRSALVIYTILLIALFVVLAVLVRCITSVRSDEVCLFVLLIIGDLVFMILALSAICKVLWTNSKYCFTSEGVEIHYLLYKKKTPWSSIINWGIFPIYLLNSDYRRDFIFLFLSNKIPEFPRNLFDCFYCSDKMIVIRSTDERLKEVEAVMEQQSIPRVESKSIDGTMVPCFKK